nr:immunoglobulin heavy chain junction region [Macaca mulatta]
CVREVGEKFDSW